MNYLQEKKCKFKDYNLKRYNIIRSLIFAEKKMFFNLANSILNLVKLIKKIIQNVNVKIIKVTNKSN